MTNNLKRIPNIKYTTSTLTDILFKQVDLQSNILLSELYL